MIFAGVDLLDDPARAGFVLAHEYEQVLDDETQARICLHDFDMREPLPVRADLVLALNDQCPAIPEYAVGFFSGLGVKFQYGLMILRARTVSRAVVSVVLLEGLMPLMCRSTWRVHVGGGRTQRNL